MPATIQTNALAGKPNPVQGNALDKLCRGRKDGRKARNPLLPRIKSTDATVEKALYKQHLSHCFNLQYKAKDTLQHGEITGKLWQQCD
ncbi:hypothetical protein [Shewanella sp. FJAT-52076]|uniref:hypothetical protein n=1 Tax=Shewanella sp. FJAT-52076 TaxID=2864202 RepID=UPI001C6597F3|nr:hypothetical protein [Shewanella sp. FJAT-52076]QYJ74289.1 hypothetical protein K0H79_13015 [Shewanella sp. FJAT-52076]